MSGSGGTAGKRKPSILFVDDDENLLQALQRMLRGLRGEWDMVFAASGPEALTLMERQAFDVVVSDMRMPEMDGATLLSTVEQKYPGTVRVILSGYADDKSIFRSIGPAHQYVAKPCEPEDIMALMQRALKLRQVLAQPALRALAAGLRTLPSPPDLYLRVTREMAKDEASAASVARIIADDMAMTAELLRITNSSYFAFHSQVSTVVQAVRLLGMDTVRTLVLAVGIFKQYAGRPGLGAMVSGLSRHGLAVGSLARRLAERDGVEEPRLSQAFCAGMLCSVGALILLDSMPERYPALLSQASAQGVQAAERAALGASQDELGAYLLGLWGFPDVVVEAVLYQLRPSECMCHQKSVLTYLHLARVVGPPFPLVADPAAGRPELDQAYVTRLGVDAAVLTAGEGEDGETGDRP